MLTRDDYLVSDYLERAQPVYARQRGGYTWMKVQTRHVDTEHFDYWLGEKPPLIDSSLPDWGKVVSEIDQEAQSKPIEIHIPDWEAMSPEAQQAIIEMCTKVVDAFRNGWRPEVKVYADDCDHQYSEVLSGVKCIKCGHFVGNWE